MFFRGIIGLLAILLLILLIAGQAVPAEPTAIRVELGRFNIGEEWFRWGYEMGYEWGPDQKQCRVWDKEGRQLLPNPKWLDFWPEEGDGLRQTGPGELFFYRRMKAGEANGRWYWWNRTTRTFDLVWQDYVVFNGSFWSADHAAALLAESTEFERRVAVAQTVLQLTQQGNWRSLLALTIDDRLDRIAAVRGRRKELLGLTIDSRNAIANDAFLVGRFVIIVGAGGRLMLIHAYKGDGR